MCILSVVHVSITFKSTNSSWSKIFFLPMTTVIIDAIMIKADVMPYFMGNDLLFNNVHELNRFQIGAVDLLSKFIIFLEYSQFVTNS